jgi:uncharacterized protein YecE (DUF72 family)
LESHPSPEPVSEPVPSIAEAEHRDAEQAFDRLEALLAELPAIQEEDKRLTRAREARELRTTQQRTQLLEAEIASYGKAIDTALIEAKAASDRRDKDEEGRQSALARMYTELRYTRLATMQRSGDKLRALLEQGVLSLDDPLDDYALSDEEYHALEARIRAFQEEYQQLYAFCRRLEGLENDGDASITNSCEELAETT